jgi:hypothetical protein
MNLTAELDQLGYDIEQLWIEGYRPITIAGLLDCHVDLVYAWMKLNSVEEAEGAYDPYATINS